MKGQDHWDALVATIREVFDDDTLEITPETTAADVTGWDSIVHVELIVTIEDQLGIRFSTSEAAGMETVGHMSEFISKHLGAAG